MLRVTQLYQEDAQLHALWSSAMDTRGIAMGSDGSMAGPAMRARTAPRWAAGGWFSRSRRRSAHRDDRDRRLGHAQRAERTAGRAAAQSRSGDRFLHRCIRRPREIPTDGAERPRRACRTRLQRHDADAVRRCSAATGR
jgi:hypothetical protein